MLSPKPPDAMPWLKVAHLLSVELQRARALPRGPILGGALGQVALAAAGAHAHAARRAGALADQVAHLQARMCQGQGFRGRSQADELHRLSVAGPMTCSAELPASMEASCSLWQ